MEYPIPGGSGGGGDKGDEWWKKFEEEKKQKSYEKKDDKWPQFGNPAELFSLRNQNAVFIKGKAKKMPYGGGLKNALKPLIANYDMNFKGGDQYLENTSMSVEELRKTAIGKLAIARDALMAFLYQIYNNDKEEWQYLQATGFLEVMIRVAQGETCNNELAKELRKCLGL